MRMTNNRKLILRALQLDGVDLPPFSVSSIYHNLESAFTYKWSGWDMKTLPSVVQIHRTVRDLFYGGLIVANRVKCDAVVGGLPYWELRYQLSSDVERNFILSECQLLHHKVGKAVNGVDLFGMSFGKGLPLDEVEPLKSRVRVMMQCTHPDKAPGFEHEFKLMLKCHEWIKDGIPLSTPAYVQSGNAVEVPRLMI